MIFFFFFVFFGSRVSVISATAACHISGKIQVVVHKAHNTTHHQTTTNVRRERHFKVAMTHFLVLHLFYFKVEVLLESRLERSQLRWFGHLVRMPLERLPREVLEARPTGRRPRGRPRTRWRDYMDSLALDRLGILQEEVDDVARERETWSSLVEMLPPRPDYG